MLSGMAALNGGLGGAGLSNGTAGTMDALTQAYSGIQQYAAAALPTLYSQSLLQQQGAAGSQKEGQELNSTPASLIRPLPEPESAKNPPRARLKELLGFWCVLGCRGCKMAAEAARQTPTCCWRPSFIPEAASLFFEHPSARFPPRGTTMWSHTGCSHSSQQRI